MGERLTRREWLRRLVAPSAALLLAACTATPSPGPAPTGGTTTPKPGATAAPAPTPSPTPAPTAQAIAERYARAWEAGDFAAMYRLLTPAAQASLPEADFVRRYRAISDGVGITQVRVSFPSPAREPADQRLELPIQVTYQTGRFGEIKQDNTLPLERGPAGWGVAWRPALIFKELGPNQFVRVIPEDPPRGPIFDRQGRVLAEQGEVAELGVIPGELKDQAAAAAALAKLLGGDPAAIQRRWADAQPDWWVPLGDLPLSEEAKAIEALKDVPGTEVRRKSARVYPHGPLAAHILGYLGAISADELKQLAQYGYTADDQVGKAGVEGWAELPLAGRRGGKVVVVSAGGDLVARIVDRPARPSGAVQLTIDLEVQRKAEAELGDKRGAVVVLDVQDNSILAAASRPTFDPNDFVLGISRAKFEQLNNDPGRPFQNRAFGSSYPIGSIFKVVTMVAALRLGVARPESGYVCTGTWSGLPGGPVLKDWLAGGHGSLNLVQGLSASCNIVFYTLGKALGEKDLGALPAHAEAFGFGKPTGLGTLPEVAGQVPRPDSLGGSVNLAIGQGEFLGTPLQVANLFAALGRGGELQRPRLVAAIDGEGAPPLPPPGKTADLPISPAERSAVLAGLRGVLKPPFGSAASTFRGFRHDIAAKTGSAETGRPDLDYLWFAAWAPAEQPRYALAAVVEAAGLSSQVVAPIGRRLLEFLLG